MDSFQSMKVKIASVGLKEEKVRFQFWMDRPFKPKVFINIINNLDETKRSKHGAKRLCESSLAHRLLCVFMCVCTVSDRDGALNQSAEFFPDKSMTLDMMIQTPRLHTVTCLYSRITGGHNSGPRLPFQTLHYLICFTGNTALSFTLLSSFLPIRG